MYLLHWPISSSDRILSTDFTSSVWNFCRWVADVPPRETSPAAKSEQKRMFLQAIRSAEHLF